MKKTEKELVIIEKEVSPIINQAQSLEIKDADSLKVGVEMLTALNKWGDRVTEDKELLTKPLNAALKEIRGRYKPLETMLETAIDAIRGKMTAYQTEALKAKQKAELEIANRVGEGKGHLKVETAIKKIEELDPVDKTVGVDEGAVSFVEVKKFKVVNMTELPLKYHIPNEAMIKDEMKRGIEITGVEYWTEQQPRNYR